MQSGMGADIITHSISGSATNAINAYNTGQQAALSQEDARRKTEEYYRGERPIPLTAIAKQVPEHLQFGLSILARQRGIIEGEEGREFIRQKDGEKFMKDISDSPFLQGALYESGAKIVEKQQKDLDLGIQNVKQVIQKIEQDFDDNAKKQIGEHIRKQTRSGLATNANFIESVKEKVRNEKLKFKTSENGAVLYKQLEDYNNTSKQLQSTWQDTMETLGKTKTYTKKLIERFGADMGWAIATGKKSIADGIAMEKEAEWTAKVKAYKEEKEADRRLREELNDANIKAGKYNRGSGRAGNDANTVTYMIDTPNGKVVATKKDSAFYDSNGKRVTQIIGTPQAIARNPKQGGSGLAAAIQARKTQQENQTQTPVAQQATQAPVSSGGLTNKYYNMK